MNAGAAHHVWRICGQYPQQLVQIRAQRAVGACSAPRSSNEPPRSRRLRMRRAAVLISSSSTPHRFAYSADGTSRNRRAPARLAVTCSARSASLHGSSCTRTAAERSQTTRRRSRAARVYNVRPSSRVGDHRFDDDAATARILGLLVSTVRARGKLCDIQGFFPDERRPRRARTRRGCDRQRGGRSTLPRRSSTCASAFERYANQAP